jgi:hypothetical protein
MGESPFIRRTYDQIRDERIVPSRCPTLPVRVIHVLLILTISESRRVKGRLQSLGIPEKIMIRDLGRQVQLSRRIHPVKSDSRRKFSHEREILAFHRGLPELSDDSEDQLFLQRQSCPVQALRSQVPRPRPG